MNKYITYVSVALCALLMSSGALGVRQDLFSWCSRAPGDIPYRHFIPQKQQLADHRLKIMKQAFWLASLERAEVYRSHPGKCLVLKYFINRYWHSTPEIHEGLAGLRQEFTNRITTPQQLAHHIDTLPSPDNLRLENYAAFRTQYTPYLDAIIENIAHKFSGKI